MKRIDEIHNAAKNWCLTSFSLSRMQAFTAGARYADSTLTDKAVEWLINASNDGRIHLRNHEEFEREFRKAMEE